MQVDGPVVAAAAAGAAVLFAGLGWRRHRVGPAAPAPGRPGIGPGLAVRWRRRADAEPATLGRDLLEIAAGLHAGLDFDRAVAPLGHKRPWSLYADQRRAGVPATEAIDQAIRPVWPELATMLAVHNRYGGPLADMLLLLADSVSEQRLLIAESRARTSEARATALVLALTGPGLGLYLLAREPHLLAPLLSEPVGLLALLAAIGLWTAGVFALRRLLRRLA